MATAFFAGAFTSHQLEPHRFLKRGQLPGSCTPSSPIAQKTRDNSRTSPSDLFQELGTKWQQRPETPVLIRRIHTSSSHHTPHQCSDSAEEWIRPGSNHPLRRRRGPPTRNCCRSIQPLGTSDCSSKGSTTFATPNTKAPVRTMWGIDSAGEWNTQRYRRPVPTSDRLLGPTLDPFSFPRQ